ncbi:MAG: class I SAM-dependent methyltransferase [Spirochaetales bacterium]|nr:class I SAM-dependent methyltransferase [Spirochaetales bacterium]
MSWWDAAYRSGTVSWDPGEYDRHLPGVVQELGIVSGRALDIGCGTGKSALWLAERGFDVTGIDVSPAAIQQARRAARGRDVEVRFITGRFPDDFTIPPDASAARGGRGVGASSEIERTLHVYDFVVDRASLQHMGHGGEFESLMADVAALVRPGGFIYSLVIAGFGVPRGWGMGVWTESAIRRLFAAPFSVLRVERTVFTPGEAGSVPAWLVIARR